MTRDEAKAIVEEIKREASLRDTTMVSTGTAGRLLCHDNLSIILWRMIMNTFWARSILILIMLGGTVSGLLTYSRILSLILPTFNFTKHWIFIALLFAISLLILRVGIKKLATELWATVAFREINITKILKFFIGGFIGCYVGFLFLGTIVLTALVIYKYLFIQ